MSYVEAINLLDRRRHGEDMPALVVDKALELTGDIEAEPTMAEIVKELRRPRKKAEAA